MMADQMLEVADGDYWRKFGDFTRFYVRSSKSESVRLIRHGVYLYKIFGSSEEERLILVSHWFFS
jgi:hypothetical protein